MPIIAAVTLLMTDHGRRNTATFLAALIVIMLADGLLTLFLLGSQSSGSQNAAHGGVQLALRARLRGHLRAAVAQQARAAR